MLNQNSEDWDRYYLYKKSKTQADVTDDLEMYKTKVYRFTMNFHDDLSNWDIIHWDRKVQITEKDLRRPKVIPAFSNQVSAHRPSENSDEAVHVGRALERVEDQEKLAHTLPDAPSKDPETFDPDKEIKEKLLLKLKLFPQVW